MIWTLISFFGVIAKEKYVWGLKEQKMISNQILQNTIEGLKGIARVELCVMDVDGKEEAATMDMGNCSKPAVEFAASPADSQEIQGYQYFKIYDEQQLEYILVAGGTGEDVYMIGKMVAFQIQNLLVAYKERFDKDNFIKNLLLDNLLLVDIYSRSKKLHIQTDVPRVVMIVESAGGKDNNVLELARTHFGSNSKDFITAVDESNVIVVKEFAETDTGKEIEKSARALEAALLKEGIREIRIAYGTIVHEIKEVSRSYKEAKMALDVGKIFFDESLTTIYKFFENSLNVSETSRQLFIHRNTLVYRLDKLQKSTGLDLRVFEDAITFKIALMVVKYMKYMETYEY